MASLDRVTFCITHRGKKSFPLTLKEIAIYNLLSDGMPRSSSELHLRVYDSIVSSHAIIVHISNLRKKLQSVQLDLMFVNRSYLIVDLVEKKPLPRSPLCQNPKTEKEYSL